MSGNAVQIGIDQHLGKQRRIRQQARPCAVANCATTLCQALLSDNDS